MNSTFVGLYSWTTAGNAGRSATRTFARRTTSRREGCQVAHLGMVDLASRRSVVVDKPKKGWKKADHLTAREREEMPRSDFALPGKGEGPKGTGSGSYPIPDKGHARSALSRVSANGTSAEKSEVREKVHEKFPGIKEKNSSRASALYDHSRSKKMRASAHGA